MGAEGELATAGERGGAAVAGEGCGFGCRGGGAVEIAEREQQIAVIEERTGALDGLAEALELGGGFAARSQRLAELALFPEYCCEVGGVDGSAVKITGFA